MVAAGSNPAAEGGRSIVGGDNIPDHPAGLRSNLEQHHHPGVVGSSGGSRCYRGPGRDKKGVGLSGEEDVSDNSSR